MAPRQTPNAKRKRSSTTTTTNANKRPRRSVREKDYKLPGASQPEEDGDGGQLFAAKSILKERADAYLVEWEDPNPETGEAYEPEWIKKANVTEPLKADWERTKAKEKGAARTTEKGAKQRKGRNSRVIHSSSSSIFISTPVQEAAATEEPLILERSPFVPPESPESPKVRIRTRRDFNRAEYTRWSQLPLSNPRAERSLSIAQPPGTSFLSSGVVPDSQSSDGSRSYNPTTQEASGSNEEQNSLTTNGTNDVTEEDSTLLDLEDPASISDPINTTASPSQPGPQQLGEQGPYSAELAASHSQEDDGGIEIPESPSQEEPDSLVQATTQETAQQPTQEEPNLPEQPTVSQAKDIETPTTVSEKPTRQSSVRSSTKEQDTSKEHISHVVQLGAQQEQNAQVIQPALYTSTQDESSGSIRPTTEVYDLDEDRETTPKSRHDSSQESPVSSIARSEVFIVSSPPHPPYYSIEDTTSTAPPRPQTPLNTSSSANMTDTSPNDIEKGFQNLFKKNVPLEPRKRVLHTTSPRAGSGTRSPSVILDQSPQNKEPVSLRTAALVNSAAVQIEEAPPLMPPSTVPEAPEVSVVREEPDMEVHVDDMKDDEPQLIEGAEYPDGARTSETVESTNDQDDADETSSLLNEDLQLLPEEYIVPLSMEGRQKSMYNHEIRRNEDNLRAFLDAPQKFDEISDIENVCNTLKAIETHIDLVYAESDSQLTGARTQALWDSDSCVKFRFLATFLHTLQKQDINIIIVLDKENERLFHITENFLKGKLFDYKYPAKGRIADWAEVQGSLHVTLLSKDSSFIVRPPSAIICLDGSDGADIRKNNWAMNPDHVVPIIHLVVPRSVGHIERCIATKLSAKTRLHTILACLGQVRADIGTPMTETPRAPEAAEMAARYVIDLESSAEPEWTLPPIHSIADIVEYKSSQSSQPSRSSRTASAPASKRPLDAEHLDPSKRVRLTPQPQPSSATGSTDAKGEITHVSDSMPGTAFQPSNLQEQLAEKQRALEEALATSKANDKRYREMEATWVRRQTDYEDLSKQYRVLLGEEERQRKTIEQANKTKEFATQRIDKLRADVSDLRTKLNEQQQLGVASEDEKVAEITRLRKAMEEEKAAKESAMKSKGTTDQMLEYVKDQLREAQDQAATWRDAHDTLSAELLALKTQQTSDVPALKKDFYDKALGTLKKKAELERIENEKLSRVLDKKDEELTKLKSGAQKGYGTRGSSVPRSPRVGVGNPSSRAASPLPTGRDRVSNLRNG